MSRSTPTRSRLLGATALLARVTSACSGSPDSAEGGTAPRSDTTGPSAEAPRSDEQQTDVQRYVALGDSYSSAPLVPVTDVAQGCFRSSANYPSLVAEALGATLDDRSCGGARTEDVTRSQLAGVPPQARALRPGTQLVTVGLGGNDGGVFSTLVNRCSALARQDPDGNPCETAMTSGGRDRLLSTLQDTQRRLTAVLREVERRSPDARVLAVGYPQIVAAGSPCPELPLAAGDYPWAERVNRALADAVAGAAKAAGATYVDVWDASRGHDVCADEPWINGSVTDQSAAAAYHPFAVEQRAVADLVLDAVAG